MAKKYRGYHGGEVYQYVLDIQDKKTKHDWYFEFANCECGPIHGRDNARKALLAFRDDYAALLKKHHGGNSWVNIYAN